MAKVAVKMGNGWNGDYRFVRYDVTVERDEKERIVVQLHPVAGSLVDGGYLELPQSVAVQMARAILLASSADLTAPIRFRADELPKPEEIAATLENMSRTLGQAQSLSEN